DLLAALYAVGRAVPFELQFGELVLVRADDLTDSVPNRAWIDLDVIVRRRQFSQKCFRNFAIGRDNDFTGLGVYNVERNFFAKQALLGGQFRLALRRNFPNQNIARLHLGAYSHYTVRPQISQSFFAYIGDVARNFLWSEFRIAGADLELIDVNGSVNVFLHNLLRDHDRVFEVVAVPRHERDEDVAPQRKLAAIGVGPVCDYLATFHMLTLANDR